MNVGEELCQSCGKPLSGEVETCPACGAKTAAAIMREEREKEDEAILAAMPPDRAAKVRDLEERAARNPESTAAWIQLSALYNDAGIKDRAIRCLEKAVALDPDNKFLAQRLRTLVAGPGDPIDNRQLETEIRRTRSASRLVIRALAALAAVAAVFVAWRLLFPPVELIARFPSEDAASPRYSPDGTKVAFLRVPKFTIFGLVDMMGGGSPGDSFLMVKDLDSGEVLQVVKFQGNWATENFAWIPGTTELAYIDYDKDSYLPTLWRVSAQGGEPTAVANTREFAWSPSGKQVAYVGLSRWISERTMRPDEEEGYLYLLDTDLGYTRTISDLSCSHPSFSLDGKHLAFQGIEPVRWEDIWRAHQRGESLVEQNAFIGDVFVHDMNEGATHRLTTGGMNQLPVFTPDGGRIAYLRYADIEDFDNELYLMNVDGTDQRRLLGKSDQYLGFRGFSFHPKGEWLVFEGVFVNPNKPTSKTVQTPLGVIGGQTNYVADLFAVRTDGGDLHRIPQGKFDYRHEPSFSPDGKRLAFEVEYIDLRREAWTMKF